MELNPSAMASIEITMKTGGSDSYLQEGSEVLQGLLLCKAEELESARMAATAVKARSELFEARVAQLEELVRIAQRERDEARERFEQLQRSLSRSPSQSNGSPGLSEQRLMHSPSLGTGSSGITEQRSPVVKSLESFPSVKSAITLVEPVSSMTEPTRATLSEVHRKQHESKPVASVSSMTEPTRATLTEVHRKLQEQQHRQDLQQQLVMQREDQEHKLHVTVEVKNEQVVDVPCAEGVNPNSSKGMSWEEFSSSVHLELEPPNNSCSMIMNRSDHMHIDIGPSSHGNSGSPQGLGDLQQQQQQQQQEGELQIGLHLQEDPDQLLSHLQQRQIDTSTSLHLQDDPSLHGQYNQQPEAVASVPTLMSGSMVNLSVPMNHQNVADVTSMPCFMAQELSASPHSIALSTGLPKQLLQSSCSPGGSVVASILSPLDNRYTNSVPASMTLPRHLAENPESDPQVMLNSLPERGKLVQAVMQAGPLLHTLLLAGPLPQWRTPPPPITSDQIPLVSMGPSSVLLPTGDQTIGLMSTHGSRDQVMRLSSGQTSSLQNGLCSSTPLSMASFPASRSLSSQNLLSQVPMMYGFGP